MEWRWLSNSIEIPMWIPSLSNFWIEKWNSFPNWIKRFLSNGSNWIVQLSERWSTIGKSWQKSKWFKFVIFIWTDVCSNRIISPFLPCRTIVTIYLMTYGWQKAEWIFVFFLLSKYFSRCFDGAENWWSLSCDKCVV